MFYSNETGASSVSERQADRSASRKKTVRRGSASSLQKGHAEGGGKRERDVPVENAFPCGMPGSGEGRTRFSFM
ncbi:MAG: hypothetical protein CW346_16535 [Bacillaceae bacterium]|nr:hypothetical protein [Bacillaceae bacterium]